MNSEIENSNFQIPEKQEDSMDQDLINHFDKVVKIPDQVPLHDDYNTKQHIQHMHHMDDLMVLLFHQYLHPMNEQVNYMIVMLDYR
jgi:hypothetical protein